MAPAAMISAVIPAYNEADRIGHTLAALRALAAIAEVIVVDDGSTDDTTQRARESCAVVIRLPTNHGKGFAMVKGIRESSGDIIALLDADLGESADQVHCLLEPVLSGEADMTIAQFPVIPGRGGGFGVAVRLARWGIRRATGRAMNSPLSGQRVLRREVWDRLDRFETGFGLEVGLTIDAIRAGFRVLEVPVTMTHRVTGRDWRGIRHRGRQFLAVARALWLRRSARRQAPASRPDTSC